MAPSILARHDRVRLESGLWLRLLSAMELLQARREARLLADGRREQALCSNACLLARALEEEKGKPLFPDGQAVLAGLTAEEIAALAQRWSQFNREENTGLALTEEELADVKKNCGQTRESGCAGGY